jgi:hypothetical protein
MNGDVFMIVAGIDYSLSSPAICVHEGDTWDYKNCHFYYLVKREKLLEAEMPFLPNMYPDGYTNDLERYESLSTWSLNILKKHNVEKVFIEGYAFGAVGRVFQIAENAGLLKYMIWKAGMSIGTIPPTAIKKFATGKGNANKEKMYDSFFSENMVDIRDKCGIMNNGWNPVSDIVDSYYIAKFGLDQENENANQA